MTHSLMTDCNIIIRYMNFRYILFQLILVNLFLSGCKEPYSFSPHTNKDKGNTTDNDIVYTPLKYTNNPTVRINGIINNVSKIHCDGGAKNVWTDTSGRFDLNVPLKLNQKNILLVYGEKYDKKYTDTTTVKIIHDDIPPKVIEYSGGQLKAHILDSIKIIFDEPIAYISEFYLQNSSYQVNLKDKTEISGNTLKFTSSFSFLYDYEFGYSVRDSAGNISEGTQIVPFYDEKFEFDGTIKDFVTDDNSENLFVITEEPNQLIQINLQNKTIINKSELSARPFRVAYNNFNDLLYITCFYDARILVFDFNTGSEIKTLVLKDDEDNHSSDPNNYPYSVAFAKNGIGLVSSRYLTQDYYVFHMLFSNLNDSILLNPAYNDFGVWGTWFLGSSDNGNAIIIAGREYLSFDPSTLNISEIYFNTNAYGERGIAANRYNDHIAGTGNSLTFMAHSSGDVINKIMRPSNPADNLAFNYNFRNGNFVYHVNYSNKDIRLYDMKNGLELYHYNLNFPTYMKTSPDGKFLFFGIQKTLYFLADETLNRYTEIIF